MKRLFTLLFCGLASATAMFAQTPFKVTTIENGEFAQGTTWYVMAIGDGGKLIKDNAGADFITLGTAQLTGADDELWCFVGNSTDPYHSESEFDFGNRIYTDDSHDLAKFVYDFPIGFPIRLNHCYKNHGNR